MAKLRHISFTSPPLNSHYEGAYKIDEIEWRRICAVDKVDNIVNLLGADAREVESVLEVGCGTGAVLFEAAKRGLGSYHTGIDVADPADHLHPGAENSTLKLSSYNGTTIPFPDASFDFVFASHVLEHVPDERNFVKEIARVSRRFVYFEVPCELHFRTRVSDLQNTLNIGHINAYTPESFVLTLTTAGLPPSAVQIFDHSLAVHSFSGSKGRGLAKATVRRILLSLNSTFASRVFTYHVGALCKVEKSCVSH